MDVFMRPYEKSIKDKEESDLAPLERSELPKIRELEKSLANFNHSVSLKGEGIAYAWISDQVQGYILKVQPLENAHVLRYSLPEDARNVKGSRFYISFSHKDFNYLLFLE